MSYYYAVPHPMAPPPVIGANYLAQGQLLPGFHPGLGYPYPGAPPPPPPPLPTSLSKPGRGLKKLSTRKKVVLSILSVCITGAVAGIVVVVLNRAKAASSSNTGCECASASDDANADGNSSTNGGRRMPVYAIVLLALGCFALLVALIFAVNKGRHVIKPNPEHKDDFEGRTPFHIRHRKPAVVDPTRKQLKKNKPSTLRRLANRTRHLKIGAAQALTRKAVEGEDEAANTIHSMKKALANQETGSGSDSDSDSGSDDSKSRTGSSSEDPTFTDFEARMAAMKRGT